MKVPTINPHTLRLALAERAQAAAKPPAERVTAGMWVAAGLLVACMLATGWIAGAVVAELTSRMP